MVLIPDIDYAKPMAKDVSWIASSASGTVSKGLTTGSVYQGLRYGG